ncbi:MAG TPA: amidase family protein [Methanomassiliicoccaceae archaeon]|nr:amidase family protein [Methanomassiliicoccaceae archaeon]
MTGKDLATTVRLADERYRMFAEKLEDPLAYGGGHSFHFSAKDNLCSVEFQARAGSRILEGYNPPFDATAIKRLKEAGGLLIGKTNMDEFGFGSFGTNSDIGVPLNPFDTTRCCGGSSGGAGAAASVLDGHLSIGVSTGGSISCPASFCGVVGLVPTYGRVSRWGLIDYGNSLDKIGLLASSSDMIARYLPVISGPDALDPTSQVQPPLSIEGDVGSVAIPEEALAGLSDGVRKAFEEAVGRLEGMGVEVRRVAMPELRFALPAYYILATAEASTNLARYCGMRYGDIVEETDLGFNELFSQVRSKDLGNEAKRRILLGTFCRMVGLRDRYYIKALQVRKLVIQAYERQFREVDAVLTPTMPFVAPRLDEVEKMSALEAYHADFLTVPPNLAGLPHISLPCAYIDGLPAGMQLVAPHWEEGRLLSLAARWEREFQYRRPEGGA